jgi:hypothetical protein
MEQNNILCRNWFNPELEVHELDLDTLEIARSCNHSEFVELINRWKYLLIKKYQVTPGQKLMIEMQGASLDYHAVIFAAWELGLTLVVDWPHAYGPEDIDNYRYTMHGRVDYAIVKANPDGSMWAESTWDEQRTRRHVDTVITDLDLKNYPVTDHKLLDQMNHLILANESTVAIVSGSGGTTGIPKRTMATHKDIYLQAKRMAKLLNFDPDSKTLHTLNLHHGASACYYFLPSYFSSRVHYILSRDTMHEKKADAVMRYKLNNVFLYTGMRVEAFLKTIPTVQHQINGVTLFAISKESLVLLKEKNINQITVIFGDTTIGYGLFLRQVSKEMDVDSYEKTFVGTRQDNLFDFKIQDGFLHVKSDTLGFDWKTSQDKFMCNEGKYYFSGRGDKFRIGNEWLDLGEIENAVGLAFGPESATAVIDYEEQKVYLVIWRDNPLGEQLLRKWFSKTYREVNLDFVTRDLSIQEFFVSRKPDRYKLKIHIRNMLKNQLA